MGAVARNQHTFLAKYTRAQRDAVVRAVIVHGMNSTQAVEAGRKGTLEGAGRFTMTPAYVRKLVAAERQKINPRKLTEPGESERAIEDARARALALVLRAFERWEREGKTGELDLVEHGKLMRAFREHEAGPVGTRRRTQPGQGNDPDNSTPTDARALLAGLQQLAGESSPARTREHESARSNGGKSAASLPNAHDQ